MFLKLHSPPHPFLRFAAVSEWRKEFFGKVPKSKWNKRKCITAVQATLTRDGNVTATVCNLSALYLRKALKKPAPFEASDAAASSSSAAASSSPKSLKRARSDFQAAVAATAAAKKRKPKAPPPQTAKGSVTKQDIMDYAAEHHPRKSLAITLKKEVLLEKVRLWGKKNDTPVQILDAVRKWRLEHPRAATAGALE